MADFTDVQVGQLVAFMPQHAGYEIHPVEKVQKLYFYAGGFRFRKTDGRNVQDHYIRADYDSPEIRADIAKRERHENTYQRVQALLQFLKNTQCHYGSVAAWERLLDTIEPNLRDLDRPDYRSGYFPKNYLTNLGIVVK